MKKLLLTCDQVFEVLTRGPFPTGDETDEHVEHHLRACHECRQLAEALRPAVELLHEVVSDDQALDLPEYQGSLPDQGPSVQRLSVVRLAKPAPNKRPSLRPAAERPSASPLRLTAMSLIALGVIFWLVGLSLDRIDTPLGTTMAKWMTLPTVPEAGPPEGVPDKAALVSLASLRLPVACLPLTHRPVSQEQAGELALALAEGSLERLRCCTECHHAGPSAKHGNQRPRQVAAALQNCQACHRG